MKILQVAPLYESVPPKYYGGTERIVSYLTEELVQAGHDVTLFASGDSVTSARLKPQVQKSLRLSEKNIDYIAHHLLMVEQLVQCAHEFDVIHSHIDYFPYSSLRRLQTPVVTTLHGRLDLQDLVPLYEEFGDIPLVSISNSHREPLPWVNWQGTVYHGLPLNLYNYYEKSKGYLAFLGRISPEKRLDYAIEIAERANKRLLIAAKVDKVDQEYFKTVIEPLIHSPNIEFIGEIGESEKNDFLGNAEALLFPIDWPEPFGLVMIEALACGTPVIAWPRGAVPEIIDPGKTGFIVEEIDQAVQAVEKLQNIDRKQCRQVFEEKFSAKRMAEDYLRIYQKLIGIKEETRMREKRTYG